MKILLYKDRPQDISSFGDEHGLTLGVVDREGGYVPDYERFMAWFGGCAVEIAPATATGPARLSAMAGTGPTMDEAIHAYCQNISGKEVTHFDPVSGPRPILVGTLRYLRAPGTVGGPVIEEA